RAFSERNQHEDHLSDFDCGIAFGQWRGSRKGGIMRGTGLLLTAGGALGQQQLWGQHMKEADSPEKVGRYQEARSAYQLALQDEEGASSDSDLRKATTWNNLALLNRYLGNYAEAREQYRKALVLFESARGPRSSQYASALHNLATLD